MRNRSLGPIVALCVLASGMIVGAPSPGGAAFPGKNGRIVFYRQVGGDETTDEIFIMKSDGTNKRRLTNNSVNDEDPQLSPNGKLIVFERDLAGEADIFRMKADGTGVKRLTNNQSGAVENKDPGWSPNGQRIVFSTDRDGDDSLYTMKADGSDEKRLTTPNTDDDDSNPRWAPNGSKIAFAREFDSGLPIDAICVIRPNKTGEKCITTAFFAAVDDPDWSADSKRIAFEGEKDGATDGENIWVVKPDGTGKHQRTFRTDHVSDPAYSPDNKRIIFEVKEAVPNRLFIMNTDGSHLHAVTPASFDVQDPDWGPEP